jgi:hypothetical protein
MNIIITPSHLPRMYYTLPTTPPLINPHKEAKKDTHKIIGTNKLLPPHLLLPKPESTTWTDEQNQFMTTRRKD